MSGGSEPRLILICLGNPGPEYAGTRHNAGFLFADWLRERQGFGDYRQLDGAEARVSEGNIVGLPAMLVKPMTSMNESGRVMDALAERYDPDEHLYAIAHDDLDVAVGSVKGRAKGGHAGHNGVRSILEAAGRRDIVRIKLGVNSTARRGYDGPVEFLLSDFDAGDRQELEQAFPDAEQVLVGQVKSFLASLDRRDGRRQAAEAYERDVLVGAREALVEVPAASPWPVLLEGKDMARVFDVVSVLAKLLRKARVAAAENDVFYARLASCIPEHLRALLAGRRRTQRVFFAVDLHVSEQGIKVIELNCAVGYGHYAAVADEALWALVQDVPGPLRRPNDEQFAPFLLENGLLPLHDPAGGCIAFLRGFGGEDMFNVDELGGVVARIAKSGGPSMPLCDEGELELRDDGLHLPDGGRIDLLYVEENLAEWPADPADSAVRRAVECGLVRTFPPLDMFLFTSKAFLAALLDPDLRRYFDPDDEESKVLRENVLWSQRLDAHIEPAAYYMLEQGLPLVVKDALGGGGRGVTILRPDSAGQQAGHILRRRMLEGGSVVQGYFAPGRWREGSDLRFDVRVLCAAHEGDIRIGPVYGRTFRSDKLSLNEPDAGVAPVYVLD